MRLIISVILDLAWHVWSDQHQSQSKIAWSSCTLRRLTLKIDSRRLRLSKKPQTNWYHKKQEKQPNCQTYASSRRIVLIAIDNERLVVIVNAAVWMLVKRKRLAQWSSDSRCAAKRRNQPLEGSCILNSDTCARNSRFAGVSVLTRTALIRTAIFFHNRTGLIRLLHEDATRLGETCHRGTSFNGFPTTTKSPDPNLSVAVCDYDETFGFTRHNLP